MRKTWMASALILLTLATACSKKDDDDDGGPQGPTGSANLTPPTIVSPSNDSQLSTLRPVFTVQNGTSDQAGAKTYQFQISDRSDFAGAPASTAGIVGFLAVVDQTGVTENAGGQTTYTPSSDLQPTTRLYWRARVVQGSSVSAWSSTATFRSKLVGFIRDGEIYDPLIHEESVGTPSGNYTWIPGVGIRLNDQFAYVRYQVPQTISSGEFSLDVSGLSPNGPTHKLKIMSMSDTVGDLFNNPYQMSAQYRGLAGNPDNAISFKAVYGSNSRILEPGFGERSAGVRFLDPGTVYHWRSTWSNSEFRLVVKQGGVTGPEIYNFAVGGVGGSYAPSPHFAYVGSNNSNPNNEPGSWPGAVYRNVWISSRPRPDSLGSALSSAR